MEQLGEADSNRLASGMAQLQCSVQPLIHPAIVIEREMDQPELVEDRLGRSTHGNLSYVEFARTTTHIDKHGDRSAIGDAKTGHGIECIAEAAGLHEDCGVAAHSVGADGYSDGFLFSRGRNQMEEWVVVDESGYLVNRDVRHIGNQ